jgi:CubicO group peptidase (beta-lactamase class C family)
VDEVKEPLAELESPGTYNWGGFFYTGFIIDPKEQMVVIFMAQLHPTGGLRLDHEVDVLAYQALND